MIKYAVRTGTPFTASALQILTGLGCRAYAATPSQCPRQATEAAQSDILITVHEKKDPKDTDGLAEIIWRENPEGQVKAYVVLNAKSGGDLIEALKGAF